MEPDPPFLLTFFSLLVLTSSLSPPTTTTLPPTKSPSSTPTLPQTKSPSSPTPSPPTTTTLPPTKSPSSPTPSTSPTPSPPSSSSSTSSATLDPKQLQALQSLDIPISKDPCSQPSLHNTTTCDSSKPFRHLLSLHLTNCSSTLQISPTALKSLSTLTTLQFLNCPIPPPHLPPQLTTNLRSFTVINSLKKLTGVYLSHLQNLTDLTISGVPITASGPSIILNNLKFLHFLTISHTNLTGFLPKHWHLNLTHIDLSENKLKGNIHISLTRLENLEFLNLSSNFLNGEIPSSFGDLLSLKNLSLASNSLSGTIPDSMAEIPDLAHLDLGSNQLNGSIPKFISEMNGLKYLNLEKNRFHGVMPFNGSFIKRLVVFKIGGNSDLCYNHSTISSKLKLGISPCDKHGLPILPPPAKDASSDGGGGGDSSDDDYGVEDDSNKAVHHHHGPSKVVLGVAIGLSSIVFLIVFLVLLSKWCR